MSPEATTILTPTEVSYDFTETRSRDGPMCVLKDFAGYVQADAYSGYDELFRVSEAREVGCWAHAKRKFDDAMETDPESAGQALATIRKLYDIESKATQEQSSPDRRRDLRQRDARPILDALKDWLDAEALRVQQRSPIDKAIGYVLNQWDALTRYLEDGRLEIDNNRAERMMKPVAIGRKNDLFVYSTETGKKSAIIMSIVESCKAIDLDPAFYLCDVLQALRQNPEPNIAELVPAAWQARHNEDAERKAARAAAVAKVAEAILAAR